MFDDRLAVLKWMRIALTEGKEKYKLQHIYIEDGRKVCVDATEAARVQCDAHIAELESLKQQGRC